MSQKVIVIGGGAAGFFTAINIAEKHPEYDVTVLEKSNKLLGKVKVSGGGRCNVTNARHKPSELVHFYPRGHKKLHPLFKTFSTSDMVNWLAERGVKTKVEDDLRMFPISDSSQTIIDCFLKEAKKYNVFIQLNTGMSGIRQNGNKWQIDTPDRIFEADKVIVATGSSPVLWKQLEKLGLTTTPPVPSLFTFNIKDERIDGLMGVSFENASVKIVGTKLSESGPMLVTHWGLSGPAILKLSAWGARDLAALNYQFNILINFIGELKPDDVKSHIQSYKAVNPKRKVSNYHLFDLPKRFWKQITLFCGINDELIFDELSKKQLNKLVEELTQGLYEVKGKSTFKEEFVTAGGIKLSEVNLESFECKQFKNLYLAGEVLDIDALTGGFNFQACWSAGWVISEQI